MFISPAFLLLLPSVSHKTSSERRASSDFYVSLPRPAVLARPGGLSLSLVKQPDGPRSRLRRDYSSLSRCSSSSKIFSSPAAVASAGEALVLLPASCIWAGVGGGVLERARSSLLFFYLSPVWPLVYSAKGHKNAPQRPRGPTRRLSMESNEPSRTGKITRG